MNKVILMGRLTRDPEVRYSQGANSMAVAKFTLAVDRRVRRDAAQTADFISCTAFGGQAEFLEKYTHQGTKLVLEGRIQTGSYTNRDGQKVYTTDVIVENLEFAESRSADSTRSGSSYARQAQPQTQAGTQAPAQAQPQQSEDSTARAAAAEASEAARAGFMDITDGLEDEGLPFN